MDITKIQLGFDIATSITIIGAAVGFVWESRRRSLGDSAAASAYQTLDKSVRNLSANFIHKVVRASSNLNGWIRSVRLEDMESGKFNEQNMLEAHRLLAQLREEIGEFYEAAHTEKYAICAVLDAFKGEQYVARILKELDDISEAFSHLGNADYVLDRCEDLLKLRKIDDDDAKFKEAATVLNTIIVGTPDGALEDFLKTFTSEEQDQADYVKTLLKACHGETGLERLLKFKAALGDDNLLSVAVTFMIQQPERVAHVLLNCMVSLNYKSIMECKEVLVFLAAACSASIQKLSFEEFDQLVKKFGSDAYLDIDSSIR